MSTVQSSRGTMVDFELMEIMANINATKKTVPINSPQKYYNVEHDIPYVEAISTEQFLREQLANIAPTVPVMGEIKETPVKLAIVEPSVEPMVEPVIVDTIEVSTDSEEITIDVDTVAEVKNNRRR
jgi:hypothetical protein